MYDFKNETLSAERFFSIMHPGKIRIRPLISFIKEEDKTNCSLSRYELERDSSPNELVCKPKHMFVN